MKRNAVTGCPCGSGHPYPACCGRFHGGVPAPDAEALMRSRYSAYVRGLAPYLLATWHASSRPESLNLQEATKTKWLGLKVIRHARTGDEGAVVEFVARCRINGRAHRIHEVSRFVREQGLWFYVDRETAQTIAAPGAFSRRTTK